MFGFVLAFILGFSAGEDNSATQPAPPSRTPPRARFETPDRHWRLELVPSKYSPKVRGACVARLERRGGGPDDDADRGERERRPRPRGWTRCLVNDRSPDRALICRGGAYVVTIDEWPGDSRRNPLVIYGAAGELIRHFRLEDLVGARQATELNERDEPARWAQKARFGFSDDQKYLVIRPPEGELLFVELSTGDLIRRGDARYARDPGLERLRETALAGPDAFFAPIEATPLPDPGQHFDFLGWVNDLFHAAPQDDSGPLLEAAARPLAQQPDDRERLAGAISAWDPQSAGPIEEWLQANAGALDLFRQAAHKSVYRYELHSEDGSMYRALLPDLGPIRTLARGMLADASRALAEGRVDAATDDYADTLGVSRQLLGRPTLIERLVGLNNADAAFDQLLRLPLRATDQTLDYAALQRRFSSPEFEIPNLSDAVEFERLALHDTMQRVFAPDAQSGKPVLDREALHRLAQDVSEQGDTEWVDHLDGVDYEQTLAKADEYFDRWADVMRSDFPAARDMAAETARRFAAETNPLLQRLVPNLSRVSEVHATVQTRRRAALLGFALHEHRRRTGSFPSSLNELNPVLLPPADAVDPLSGQPFHYARDGDSFRLWSLGLDGADDAGRNVPLNQRGGDPQLWPPAP